VGRDGAVVAHLGCAPAEPGTHTIRVRVTDEYGREHRDHLVVEVTGPERTKARISG
jgi:hypothetical protein